MEVIASFVLVGAAALLALPVLVFAIEVVAAVALPSNSSRIVLDRVFDLPQRVAVILPAHNESEGLGPALSDIKQQLKPGDRLVVVADNCTDNTSAVALAHGAEVVERHDPLRRGKGYALDYGLQHLCSDPPDVVLMVDADCRLASGTIDELANTCAKTGRPVQALDLMTAPAESQINHQVSQFAWRIKNLLRPSGLAALRLPCQLMGTGMAFPWDVIRAADLASGSIVEDLKLGLDLTAAGHPPVFCPAALVTSQFASSVQGARTQRERWERGHIYTIVTTVPHHMHRAVLHRDWNLLALTLDLAVPPLSLLAVLVAAIFAAAGAFSILGYSSVPLAVSSVALVGFVLAVSVAWVKCGRDVLPLRATLLVAPYIVQKIALHSLRLFKRGNVQWVRTDRAKSE